MPRPSPHLRLLLVLAFGLPAAAAQAQPAPQPAPVAAPPAPVPPPPGPPVSAPEAPPTPVAPPAAPSVAEPPPPLPPTQLGKPVIDVSVPEPAPPEQRRYHMHDGFYLRVDAGFNFARTNVSSDRPGHPSYSVGGAGFALDALVGGSPSVGFAVGGAISIQGFGYGNDGSAGLGLIGVFVDGFPMANDGLHLGGSLGYAGSRTTRPAGVDELKGRGFGGSAWCGYDWWVADEWSMGTLVRVSGAGTGDSSHNSGPDAYKLSSGSYEVAILFSVLYH